MRRKEKFMRKLLGLSALALFIGIGGASAAPRPVPSYGYTADTGSCQIYHCSVNGG
jgi:hypothetical protein